jgi:hypothetical protein
MGWNTFLEDWKNSVSMAYLEPPITLSSISFPAYLPT